MTFGDAITTCFKKYATFSGRAVRSEYWYFFLFCFLASLGASILDGALFASADAMHQSGPLNTIFSLGTLLPSLAVACRRLHDIGRSGWWILIAFTGIGILLLLYWYCQKGTDGENAFGPPAQP